jgi:hypothetical protein
MRAGGQKTAAVQRKRKPAGLTAKQMRDAELLKSAWTAIENERKARNLPHSKKHLAGRWKVHPSLVSQYVNGHIPLNIEAQLWFADYLGISPARIWPDFLFKKLCPGNLSPDAIEVALTYASLSETVKDSAKNLLASLPKRTG